MSAVFDYGNINWGDKNNATLLVNERSSNQTKKGS